MASRADAAVMARREMFTTVALSLIATAIGLVTWIVTHASAPRYSYGRYEDMGDSTSYMVVLLVAALVIGFVAPARAGLLGALLGLPGLLLSPWTAPRGDDDGLWVLIIPTLGVFVLVLMGAAKVSSRARRRLR